MLVKLMLMYFFLNYLISIDLINAKGNNLKRFLIQDPIFNKIKKKRKKLK